MEIRDPCIYTDLADGSLWLHIEPWYDIHEFIDQRIALFIFVTNKMVVRKYVRKQRRVVTRSP